MKDIRQTQNISMNYALNYLQDTDYLFPTDRNHLSSMIKFKQIIFW